MLSIVIPVYNGEKYIEETLRYIQASTYDDFEIIIVNDGSKDQSGEIVDRLSREDSRIKYYYKKNGGIASARNYGMDKAAGKYICFVDQDDIVLPDMFEILIDDLKKTGADFAQGSVSQNMEDMKQRVEESAATIKKGTPEYDHCLGALIVRGGVIETPHRVDCNIWNKIYSLDFLRKYKIQFKSFLDYEDDWIFTIGALKNAKVVTVRQQIIYIWRDNEQSESRNRVVHDKYLEDFYRRHCELRSFLLNTLKECKLSEDIRLMFEGELQKEAMLWGLSNETGRGIKNRTIRQSTEVMKVITKTERKNGIIKGMLRRPLPISVYGQQGMKRAYCKFRDIFLTGLLLNHMERFAVILNKKLFHGRWHN